MNFFMLNWTAKPVPPEYMMVARQVAVLMGTKVYEENILDFTHEICAGRLRRGDEGLYGPTGGKFFNVDFGEHDGQPCQAEFFIPHAALHLRFDENAIITVQRYSAESGCPVGYPDDVDMGQVKNGGLKIKPRSR